MQISKLRMAGHCGGGDHGMSEDAAGNGLSFEPVAKLQSVLCQVVSLDIQLLLWSCWN